MNGEYHHTADWSAVAGLTDIDAIMQGASGLLEDESFSSGTDYDALNRPVAMTTPDNSVTRPRYNEANLLEGIEANLHGCDTPTIFVKNIDYDAKGQRTLIEYGSGATPDRQGVITTYNYDPQTFRLIDLYTRRGASFTGDCENPQPPPPTVAAPAAPSAGASCGLQNLHYTYDPAGNITHIQDDAQQTIYFRNTEVKPSADYTYDAVYRLIEATGREHLGQNGGGNPLPPTPTSHTDEPRVGLLHPHDGNAMGRYIQRFVYDEVGNFLEMSHCGTGPVHPTDPCWTRTYDYDETSLIEDGADGTPRKVSNRLSTTTIGTTTVSYGYDEDAGLHGNMTAMPHLPLMAWDFNDQLQASASQIVNNGGTPEITYYVYDATGQRVRKVTELQAPDGETPRKKNERIYLGGFEVYRAYSGAGEDPELERETLHVMDDKQRVALVETKTVDEGVAIGVADLDEVIRYQLNNHLGSSSVELSEVAGVISYEEYYPYGSTSFQAMRNDWDGSIKRYRYTGMERDEETALNYHKERYYSSWLGRWIGCDPLGTSEHSHLYSYSRENPITFFDTTGKEARRRNTEDLMLSAVGAETEEQAQLDVDLMLIEMELSGRFQDADIIEDLNLPFSSDLFEHATNIVDPETQRNLSAPHHLTSTFRIILPQGFRDYMPIHTDEIDPIQQERLQNIMEMLTSTELPAALLDLIQRTRQSSVEWGAYIMGSGELGTLRHGEQEAMPSVDLGEPEEGAVGMVHTHPTSPEIVAPPSEGDFFGESVHSELPINLQIETSGRMWGQFYPGYAVLLGQITAAGRFEALNPLDPLRGMFFSVIGWGRRTAIRMRSEIEGRSRRELNHWDRIREARQQLEESHR